MASFRVYSLLHEKNVPIGNGAKYWDLTYGLFKHMGTQESFVVQGTNATGHCSLLEVRCLGEEGVSAV